MSNYIEHENIIAFHPGYYIKELVDNSGLTQEDFARRLGTTPKNLSILIRGEQDLSLDMAARLSRMLGTTVSFWLNLQQVYDEKRAELMTEEELKKERDVFKWIDYRYFRDFFQLPDLPRKTDEQIKNVREFLSVASLRVLEDEDLAACFRSDAGALSKSNIVNANVMLQIGINQVLKTQAPKFDKRKLKRIAEDVLQQTNNADILLPRLKEDFSEAGVVLVVLPNLKNSGINGASKRVDGKMLLLVNDRRHYVDTFWFTLFHEIGHIMNGDLGITGDDETEDLADMYAREKLIPQSKYEHFLMQQNFISESSIRQFAVSINRDPGIVAGRLVKDRIVPYTALGLIQKLRHPYTAEADPFYSSQNTERLRRAAADMKAGRNISEHELIEED